MYTMIDSTAYKALTNKKNMDFRVSYLGDTGFDTVCSRLVYVVL